MPVVGGNIIATLVGVTAFQTITQPALAAGLAVGGAILVMSLLRCLHPPGGAAALTAVIGGSGVHGTGYAFAFAPVGINSIALVALALFIHHATARSYPHVPAPPAAASPTTAVQLVDIDAALDEMHESFDVSRDDLDALVNRAQAHAARRRAQ